LSIRDASLVSQDSQTLIDLEVIDPRQRHFQSNSHSAGASKYSSKFDWLLIVGCKESK
jgi:hypothetical protein